MKLKEKRNGLLNAVNLVLKAAQDEGRVLTPEEITDVEAKHAEIENLGKQITLAEKSAGMLKQIGNLEGEQHEDEKPGTAKSLGEHFVKSAGNGLALLKGHVAGTSISAPEYKAASDTHVTTGTGLAPLLTDVDPRIVQGYRQRLTIADLLGSGTITGSSIQYFVEGALEGTLTSVAEGATKPQIHIADPTPVVDSLKKLAGWISVSDEMMEDLPFLVSEINGRLLYQLALIEEQQLLNGNGTGANLRGVLQRSGIQPIERGNAASGETVQDTIFRALTAIQTGSGMDADGIVIHPADYQSLRLAKDANGQYFGGGFFSGAYGNGGLADAPNIWGVRTVVTPSIAQGTVLVGAFAQAGTVYRKGGVRVESTNSDQNDFINNKVKIRAEERIALAVRYPTAFAKVTITPAA